MKIIDIQEKTFSINSDIKNAYISFAKMDCSVVAIKTDVKINGENVVGYGFHSNGRYAVSELLTKRFIPRLNEANEKDLLNDEGNNFSPEKISKVLMQNEKPGGHGERSTAVGTLDMAIWDIVSKIEQVPLYEYLAKKYGNGEFTNKIFVYAAGGYYYPGKDIPLLLDEMKGYLDLGFTTVKMKIGGAPLKDDLKRIESVLKLVGDGQNLCVDANGRFDLKTAIKYGVAIEPYNLKWYEEAGDPLDYKLNSELSKTYKNGLATGENLFSMQDSRNLIRYGGMRKDIDWLQFDCSLSYGLVEYLKTLKMMKENNWNSTRVIPHGGHQISCNIAAGLNLGGNEIYPSLFQPFGGFPDSSLVENSYVTFPKFIGMGYEHKKKLNDLFKRLFS
ncbi:mandelate racemase/muconate lactonizing enzyme family protein [Candidatus Pelagibacter sp. Uisw_099_02]|uniref:mandelate racemase/muconate lactonizing enzyme family protein n=1 Tax=Candidatus Pelagibacter sp. Uisw_099_02 TaxID=3230981 RepID=UPI0039E8AAA1